MAHKPDALEFSARQLCLEAGIDPDIRLGTKGGTKRGHPAWTEYRDAAHKERTAAEQKVLADKLADKLAALTVPAQTEEYSNSPLTIVGDHEENTIGQMRNCMRVGNVVAGAICADGHLGYAQPVGGVIGYENHISVSGVGYDIGCGNMAARLDTKFSDVAEHIPTIIRDVKSIISFGIGRINSEKVEHELFDKTDLWKSADMEFYKKKAEGQLGTVGSGNHYVDILRDEEGYVWIGVHFGSRGLGHTSATKFTRAAGGKDGMNVAPTVLDVNSEAGRAYIAAMTLAGQYAYAGREWVVERVRRMIGGHVTEMIHNHHNYAWEEEHFGRKLWVVRKGATPAFPGQRGFIGGSMGDDAVIIEGVDSPEAKSLMYSTVHGAGRPRGRKATIRMFTQAEMDQWLKDRGVTLAGGSVDESPMAYRRLPDVLTHHAASVRVLHTLRPFAVAMAGNDEFDPWKD